MTLIKNNEKKVYLIVALTSLLFFILMIFNELDIYQIIGAFLKSSKEEIFASDIGRYFSSVDEISFIRYFKIEFTNSARYLSFEESLTRSLALSQIVIPILSSIGGLIMYENEKTINSFKISRKKNYKKFIISEQVRISTCISISIFFAFIVYYLLALFFFGSRIDAYHIRTDLFLDFFGNNFYYKGIHFYYFLISSVKFLLIPFCLCYLSTSIALSSKNKSIIILTVLLYFFGLTVLMFPLTGLGNINKFPVSMLFAPSTLFAISDYYNAPTLLLLITNIFPILLGSLLTFRRMLWKNVEIC